MASKDQANIDQTNHSDQNGSVTAALGQTNTSPLFTVLPGELRLQIYEEMFEGSRASYKQKHTVGCHTSHHVLLPTYHCNFLLTCHQAYNEALKPYWSKTILYGDPDDRELVFFLPSVVPEVAKLYVKHIRGLESYSLHKCPVHEFLDDFQSLQTIGFESGFFFNMTRYVREDEAPPTMKEQVEEHFKTYSLRDFSNLISDSGPAVLSRVYFSRGMMEGPLLTEGQFERDRKVCFYNYSTAKIFDAGYPSYRENDEACFAKVLENQLPGGDRSGQEA